MKEDCRDCRWLGFEQMPDRKHLSAHCLSPRKPDWLGKKRTLEICTGRCRIESPAWCPGKDKK